MLLKTIFFLDKWINKGIKAFEKKKKKKKLASSPQESGKVRISRSSFNLSSKDKVNFQTSVLILPFG